MQLADFAERRPQSVPQRQIGRILATVTWYGQAAEEWRRGDLIVKRREDIRLDLIWQADGSARLAGLPGMALTAEISCDNFDTLRRGRTDDLILQAGGMKIVISSERLMDALAARPMASVIPFLASSRSRPQC